MPSPSSSSGPLSWVHPEIEVALDEVGRALTGADWSDAAGRILVQAQLHQVSGALHMVELPGPRRLAVELEQVLGGLAAAPDATLAEAARQAIGALRNDLSARLAGRGVRDLDLLPALQGLGACRGVRYSPCELFLPLLDAFPPGDPAPAVPTEAARRLRADYQRAMLTALRDPDQAVGQRAFNATLMQVAGRAPGRFGKARWELLAQVLSELPYELADPAETVELRRLLTAIDRQLRRNCNEDDAAGDEVMREALYLAGSYPRPSAPLRALLSAARVPELLAAAPAAVAAGAPPEPRHVQLAGALAEAGEVLEGWVRSQGDTLPPPSLGQAIERAARLLDQFGADEALLLLDEVREAVAGFPSAARLEEARLEPVVERLAGLHQYAQALADGDRDGAAAPCLHRLRERLGNLEVPVGANSSAFIDRGTVVAEPADGELLGVFLDEADQLLRDLHEQAALLVETRQTVGVLAQARSRLQTLRGSGLVAGLQPLAVLCAEVDRTLADWIPGGERPWDEPARLLDDSARALEVWLARLATDRKLVLASGPLIERARALRSPVAPVAAAPDAQLPADRPVAPIAQPVAREPVVAWSGSVVQPALEAESIDHPAPELLPVFLEECADLLPRLDGALKAWSECASSEQGALALQRGLHTLKGSARMSGLMRQGARAHRLEDLVLRWSGVGETITPQAFREIQAGLDELALGIQGLAQPELPTAPPTEPLVPPLPSLPATGLPALPWSAQPVPAPVLPASPAPAVAPPAPPAPPPALPGKPVPPTEAVTEAAAPDPAATVADPLLRIRVEALDRMANAAGEAGIGRARADSEMQAQKRGLADLAENIQRLKAQLREIEIQAERALPAGGQDAASRHGFDPLELDRYTRLQELARILGEGIDDVHTVHQGLRRSADEIELALRQQGRVIRELQQDLLRARMLPFASLSERLQRAVRQAARESGRELSLRIEGGQHEVDRAILERLAAPLEHLLRNATAHGIEPPETRLQAGKPAHGLLQVILTPGEHEVALRVRDDGRGVDLERVRTQAESLGLLAPGQACSTPELLQLIFRPGFSTAGSVTSLAGRGVGLDVVRSEVTGLGGRIHVDTRAGQGTEFTLVIPVTLATVQAVVVRAANCWVAIPAPLVEQVRPVPREGLAALHREGAALWQGLRYPVTSLDRVLGLGDHPSAPSGAGHLVFLRSGDLRCALQVDELAGAQEIVVKAVSPHLARIPGIGGASVLGNGRIVLIVDPVRLAVGSDGRIPAALQLAEPPPRAATVMVVDDSITVRRVTTRLLERAGYQVRLAKDGQDALDQLAEALPDAMLLDVEMPRMDGFELIGRLRAAPRTAALPVVVISSRAAERHRAHAAALGVQGYLGKPYRDQDLVALLAGLLRDRGGRPGVDASACL